MSAAPLPLADSASPTERTLRAAGAVVAAYLAISVWPMLLHAEAAHAWTLLALHLAALSALLLALAPSRRSGPLLEWLPLLLGPFLYVELRWLIPALGRPHADALLQRWELAIFSSNPSASWAPHAPNVVLSEVLHFAYASYYALVLAPPVLLALRGRREAYARTLLALAIVYATCFVTYLIFPVDGPRYLLGPAAAPEGPVRSFVLHLLDAGSSRGTAFPSSHVAASVVASLCALEFQRKLGLVVAVLTLGLALATVYGGFHYALDALAGGIVGTASWAAARALWRALSTPDAQSASAA